MQTAIPWLFQTELLYRSEWKTSYKEMAERRRYADYLLDRDSSYPNFATLNAYCKHSNIGSNLVEELFFMLAEHATRIHKEVAPFRDIRRELWSDNEVNIQMYNTCVCLMHLIRSIAVRMDDKFNSRFKIDFFAAGRLHAT